MSNELETHVRAVWTWIIVLVRTMIKYPNTPSETYLYYLVEPFKMCRLVVHEGLALHTSSDSLFIVEFQIHYRKYT